MEESRFRMSNQVLDQDKIWERLRTLLPENLIDNWLKGTRLLQESPGNYVIEVPNAIFRKRVLENWERIIDSLSSILGQGIKVDVQISKFIAPEEKQREDSYYPPKNEVFSFAESHLNSKYTFDRFVVGNSNKFAHAASLAVAESPGEIYNPLFLYGGVGLGKTHLMHAVGHFIKHRSPQSVVTYLSAEQFTNEYITAIRNKSAAAFRYKYRNMDILLLDDVQYISGKEGVQEEIFHTFNELHGSRKHVVLSSDRAPKEIPEIEERLRNRFEWGLIVDIQAPDYETRVAILMDNAQRDNLNIRTEVLEFIAENVSTNIRELEGCLTRVAAHSKLLGYEITLELAKEILRDILGRPRNILNPEGITECVANHFKVSVEDIKSKRRTQNIVYPRMLAMCLIRRLTDYSLESIGSIFGGRDHTTVIHAIDKIDKEMKDNPETMRILDTLMKKLSVK